MYAGLFLIFLISMHRLQLSS